MNRTTFTLLASLLLAGCQTIPGMGPGDAIPDSATSESEITGSTSRVDDSEPGPASQASTAQPQEETPAPEQTTDQPEESSVAPENQEAGSSQPVTCQRTVLRRYCLGEGVSSLLARHTPLQKAQAGDRNLLLFRDGERLTRVTAFDDQVLVVSRFYPKPDWNLLVGLNRQLVQIYGQGADRSRFPSDATDRVKQEQAIRDGKGEVRILWKQPGYRVQLLWQSPERILLSFLAEELKQRLEKDKAASESGTSVN